MRDYKQVNIERYERDEFTGKATEKNIYAAINPTGNYGVYKITQLLRLYIKKIAAKTGKTYDKMSFLDCGCGTGLWTRVIANLLESPENVYGFEYSKNRLHQCIRMNPAIHYAWGDIVGGVSKEFADVRFDGVIAVDVISQLRERADILIALENIRKSLGAEGLFLWYEINAVTHDMNYEADTQGFSEREMDEYASATGFKLVYSDRAYGSVNFFGRNYSTYYNINDSGRGIKFMEIVEPILIKFGHLNNIRIYCISDEAGKI